MFSQISRIIRLKIFITHKIERSSCTFAGKFVHWSWFWISSLSPKWIWTCWLCTLNRTILLNWAIGHVKLNFVSIFEGSENLRSNYTECLQEIRYSRSEIISQWQRICGRTGQSMRQIHQQQCRDTCNKQFIQIARTSSTLLWSAIEEKVNFLSNRNQTERTCTEIVSCVPTKRKKFGRRWNRRNTVTSHGRIYIYWRQGRIPKVLFKVACKASRAADIGIGRRWGDHDFEAEEHMWLWVHIQVATHVLGCWR